ncbi:MAG: CpsD/CapB family tyrosine-protein kinase [Ktedonobacteraceae bacterium]
MQEEPDSVTQKFAYNNGLYRYMSSTLVEEDTRRTLASPIEEEIPIVSLATRIEEPALSMSDDAIEELVPSFMEEQIQDTVESEEVVESEAVVAEAEKEEQEQELLPSEENDEQELSLVEAVSPEDTSFAPFPTEAGTPLPSSLPTPSYRVNVPSVRSLKSPQIKRKPQKVNEKAKQDAMLAQTIREQCRQLCVSLFFREQSPIHSLGFTSSVRGEGKSFLAILAASELAKDSSEPVTLLECNWENPTFHHHFGFAPTPGLAEWLRGECSEMAIRHHVGDNLTVIPAGNGHRDAVKLLQHIQQKKLPNLFGCADELLVVDLPPIMTSAYGVLAASNVETLVVVVRAGVTSGTLVAETCAQLKDASVHGLLLNQVQSQVPRWIRQLM